MKKKTEQFNIVYKFVILYALLAIILTLVFTAFFYFIFASYTFNEIRNEALDIAEAISGEVNFDGHNQLLTPEDTESEVYERIFDDLLLISESYPRVSYVYTMRQRNSGDWEFVVDASWAEDENENGVIDPEESVAEIGEYFDVSEFPELPLALFGPTADRNITNDIWGSWISGYAPIFDSNGVALGIVGVDISVDELVEERQLLWILIYLTLFITFSLSTFFGFFGVSIFKRESQQINRALQIRAEDLERQVKKRTEALEHLMAMVVHDLKSPLAAMKWNVEMLLEKKRRSKAEREQLSELSEMADRMLMQVNKFLEITRASSGHMELNRKVGNLDRLLNKVAKPFVAEAKSKKLDLEIITSDTLPRFSFDEVRISEAIENLIANAIKFTKSGSIEIRLIHDQKRKMARVEVEDTGMGIAEEDIDHLFKPFSRLKSAETGTGLGLAMVKGIVEAHQGHIGVDSKPKKGSTFWFELPLSKKQK